MIMMLIRTALWGVAILAVSLAFVFLKDADGGVMIDLNGRAFGPFKPLEFVAAVFILALALWLIWKLFNLLVAIVRFFAGDETALSRYWFRSQERRGFDALSEGLVAMAEGDGRTAITRARKAERLLARPDLTNLLMAQASAANGDAETAKAYYKTMASEQKTAFVGVKGLLTQALDKGETERALKLAQHAFTLKPKSTEVMSTLFGLQSNEDDWSGARETLSAMTRANALPRDIAGRREAVLMLAEAEIAVASDNTEKARDLALRANKKSPGLAPAAVMAARLTAKSESPRRASRILKEAWRQAPHPDIAAAFAALAPEETPAERRKRFRDLTKAAPDHVETQMLNAELALADNDFGEAKAIAEKLIVDHPTARSLSIMAAAEKGGGADDATIRAWLAKAISAARGPQWICDKCGAHHREWSPTCDDCEAFDTLSWRDDKGETATEQPAAMLPLTVGTLDEVAQPASEEELAADKAALG